MSDDTILQLVTFKIENQEFGIDILKVQEINKMMTITKVPNAPESVKGVINLRGKIIPVVDLRKKLGFHEKSYDKSTRIIVVECDSLIIGFIVDSVSEVLRIAKNTVEPPPPIVSGISSEFIDGIGRLSDRLFILLNLDRIFNTQDRVALKEVSS